MCYCNEIVKVEAPETLRVTGAFFVKAKGDQMEVIVQNNDIERALRDFKRKVQREGLTRELKRRTAYEKPSVKRKRKSMEAERRRRKLLRRRRPERD